MSGQCKGADEHEMVVVQYVTVPMQASQSGELMR